MTIQMPLPQEMRAGGGAGIPARVVALSERQSAIFFDADHRNAPVGARITASSDGRPFDGPVAVTRLSRGQGGTRYVLLVARAASGICNSFIRIEAEGRLLARIDPLALQSPLVDPLALVTGLDEAGGLRLLKLLLTTGASLFGKGDLGGFGALVGQLVEGLTSAVPLSAWCGLGRSAGILSWRLPADLTLPALRDLCILHEGRARRFTDFEVIEEGAGRERLLHLMTSRPLPEGADLIVLSERPVRLAGPGAAAARPIQGWLERRGADVRARTLDWLDGLASTDATVSALRDELACPTGVEPKLGVLHLSETPSGLLYLFSVDDPRGLLRAISLSTAGDTVEVPCGHLDWHERHGTVVAGFARTNGRSGGAVSIAPVFLSGRVGAASTAAPAPFDGQVPAPFRGLGAALAAPKLAEALPPAMRARPVWRRRVTEFGALPVSPAVALVIAAGEAPEQLHAVIASLMSEPGGRNTEIVVHQTDGTGVWAVQQTLASLAAIHRIGIRLVSVAAESFASERLRAALAETRAPRVLAVGSGDFPSGAGWLAAWRRRVRTNATPAATWVATNGCDGSAAGSAVGLNAAAVALLVAARPLLPDVDPDLRVTPALEHTTARGGVTITSYEQPAGCELGRAAQRIAVDAAKEASHG